MLWSGETDDGIAMSWDDRDTDRFSEDLSDEMRAIFSQISWTAKSGIISEHGVSGEISTINVVALIKDVNNFNKKTRLGLKEITPDLVLVILLT